MLDGAAPALIEDLRAHATSVLQGNSHERNAAERLGMSFGDFQSTSLPPRQEVIFGLGRREKGLLNAVTNAGKSTVLRNLAIACAVGRRFSPLRSAGIPIRVALMDSEDSENGLQADLCRMASVLNANEVGLLNGNLYVLAQPRAAGEEDIKLNRPDHFDLVLSELATFKPDLILVDTISSFFEIRNENDNSEIKEMVMAPLKQMSVALDAALLAAHHIGKSKAEEGGSRESAHRGRGASAFADQSRVLFNLEKDQAQDRLTLHCAKVKGVNFNDHLLELNFDTRWLTAKDEIPAMKSSFDLLMELFVDGAQLPTAQIEGLLKGRVQKRRIAELLKDAIATGDLEKFRHGVYRRPQGFGFQEES